MSQSTLAYGFSAPATGLKLFSSLINGELKPGMAWSRGAYRVKYMLRALSAPLLSYSLLNCLAQNARLAMILRAQPSLPAKLYRPYLAANFDHQTVLTALSQHYFLLEKHLPAMLFESYLTATGATLAVLEGKNGEHYRIKLLTMDQLDKEGEATLLFESPNGERLAIITFSVFNWQNRRTLFIGGVQGARPETPHEAIQGASKGCHGLFPKRLLIEALCHLASHLAVEQILAAGNQTHIYQHWRYRHKKKRQLFADYDEFWLSLHGRLTDDNHFLLPASIGRKSLDDIASKKRAEYRRRYALMDNLAEQLETHF
ncbi:VirK/YbjX family protein [Erwiniaceae bacterium BAC15a-03b]|uniref:VirK/YbjX family protein n=1 Tax=Winslowiella arboricola TaxID=2978220 RepID=A0A9J6PUG0_9GAMM|nr:VirK/YbjX family protein [Winslowiella arboricola]MCU5775825.1 VirK/YbjX family protein [Winslowiella arboricola]MCU5779325.1 VirK/YbjX family protein [Winslowiella arboricola]